MIEALWCQASTSTMMSAVGRLDSRPRIAANDDRCRSLGRRVLAVLGVVLLLSACGSDDDPLANETAGAPDSPKGVADFVTHQTQRRAIIATASAVSGVAAGEERVWELQCRWAPEQATLARSALPWPPPDTSTQWQYYVAATDAYWAELERVCQAHEPTDLAAEPDLAADLVASAEAHIAACEALVIRLEPWLLDESEPTSCAADTALDSLGDVADLPQDLEDFLSTDT